MISLIRIGPSFIICAVLARNGAKSILTVVRCNPELGCAPSGAALRSCVETAVPALTR